MKRGNSTQIQKIDNSGFSLVELIIVIAIMAILVGIVGTQVLPYINKSREAKDQQLVSALATAAGSAYTEKMSTLDATKSYEIIVSKNAIKIYEGSNTHHTSGSPGITPMADTEEFVQAFKEYSSITGLSTMSFQSSKMKKLVSDDKKISIICKEGHPIVDLECEGLDNIQVY